MARKNYQSHLIRNRGWHNECVGYHIKGDIFDAITANTILEVEGLVYMLTMFRIGYVFNPSLEIVNIGAVNIDESYMKRSRKLAMTADLKF